MASQALGLVLEDRVNHARVFVPASAATLADNSYGPNELQRTNLSAKRLLRRGYNFTIVLGAESEKLEVLTERVRVYGNKEMLKIVYQQRQKTHTILLENLNQVSVGSLMEVSIFVLNM